MFYSSLCIVNRLSFILWFSFPLSAYSPLLAHQRESVEFNWALLRLMISLARSVLYFFLPLWKNEMICGCGWNNSGQLFQILGATPWHGFKNPIHWQRSWKDQGLCPERMDLAHPMEHIIPQKFQILQNTDQWLLSRKLLQSDHS